MFKKFPVILFFIASSSPTAEEQAEAMEYGPNVRFRNVQYVPASGALEQCDGVAGKVPEAYAEAYPTAAEALGMFMEKSRDEMHKLRDAADAQARQNAAQARADGPTTQEPAQAAQAPAAAPASGGKAKATPTPQPAAQGWTANQ